MKWALLGRESPGEENLEEQYLEPRL